MMGWRRRGAFVLAALVAWLAASIGLSLVKFAVGAFLMAAAMKGCMAYALEGSRYHDDTTWTACLMIAKRR